MLLVRRLELRVRCIWTDLAKAMSVAVRSLAGLELTYPKEIVESCFFDHFDKTSEVLAKVYESWF